MSTILTETEGFTPVIDILAQELGLMTAVVYGIVWRYCQMKDKVCSASRETIAEHAGISIKTVERHLAKLCKAGYLEDLHPEWKHRPHVYADTGKLKIEGLLKVKKGETESPTSKSGKTESPKGETESPTRSDTESNQGKTESLIRIPSYDSTDDSQLGDLPIFPEKALVIESIIAQTQTHPDQFDLGRRTEAARSASGNYAVPARAGGGDAFCDGPVDVFCEVLAGIAPALLPPKKRKQWAQKLRQIAEEWSTEGAVITAQVVERAIRAVPNDCDIGWKTYKSPYAGKFDEEIGPLLLNGGNPRQKGAPHGSHQRDNRSIAPGAVPRRVASEEEARAILGDKYRGK